MLTDREANWLLEWDIRNGVILRKAAAYGLAAPISEVLVPLLAVRAVDAPARDTVLDRTRRCTHASASAWTSSTVVSTCSFSNCMRDSVATSCDSAEFSSK